MTFRERVLVGIIASGLAVSILAPSCEPERVEIATEREVRK